MYNYSSFAFSSMSISVVSMKHYVTIERRKLCSLSNRRLFIGRLQRHTFKRSRFSTIKLSYCTRLIVNILHYVIRCTSVLIKCTLQRVYIIVFTDTSFIHYLLLFPFINKGKEVVRWRKIYIIKISVHSL